jgi:hypothetical protein
VKADRTINFQMTKAASLRLPVAISKIEISVLWFRTPGHAWVFSTARKNKAVLSDVKCENAH